MLPSARSGGRCSSDTRLCACRKRRSERRGRTLCTGPGRIRGTGTRTADTRGTRPRARRGKGRCDRVSPPHDHRPALRPHARSVSLRKNGALTQAASPRGAFGVDCVAFLLEGSLANRVHSVRAVGTSQHVGGRPQPDRMPSPSIPIMKHTFALVLASLLPLCSHAFGVGMQMYSLQEQFDRDTPGTLDWLKAQGFTDAGRSSGHRRCAGGADENAGAHSRDSRPAARNPPTRRRDPLRGHRQDARRALTRDQKFTTPPPERTGVR